jgi:hypothetical protein
MCHHRLGTRGTRAERLGAAEDAVQPLHPLEPPWRVRPHLASLAADAGTPERLMIDTTHLKARRTAASLLKKGLFLAASDAPRVA